MYGSRSGASSLFALAAWVGLIWVYSSSWKRPPPPPMPQPKAPEVRLKPGELGCVLKLSKDSPLRPLVRAGTLLTLVIPRPPASDEANKERNDASSKPGASGRVTAPVIDAVDSSPLPKEHLMIADVRVVTTTCEKAGESADCHALIAVPAGQAADVSRAGERAWAWLQPAATAPAANAGGVQ